MEKQKLKDLPYYSKLNKNTPVDKFNNNEELNKYLKELQERLYLNDWNIVCILIDKAEIKGELTELINYNYTENFAIIKLIRRPLEEIIGEIHRRPDELVLVHQLLHLVMNVNYNDEIDNYEYYDFRHNVLDKLARSLIMVKYNFS